MSIYLGPNTFRLEVWGRFALFTQPEFSAERISYPVITPSAAEGLLKSIYWHPGITYQIKRLKTINPINMNTLSIMRNELERGGAHSLAKAAMLSARKTGSFEDVGIPAHISRMQRYSTVLQNVHYEIVAEFLPAAKRPEGMVLDPEKVMAILERRIRKGQSFQTPYFGQKEFAANFAEYRYGAPVPSKLEGTVYHLGPMLYSIGYADDGTTTPFFYNPIMKDGVIACPSRKEVMGDAADILV